MEIKTKYQELQKRYNLPKFEDIDNEFELSTIEKKEFFFREVRRKIAERISDYLKILDSLMQPEPTITNLREIRALDERERVYSLYKKLMIIDRTNIEASINEDDKKTADFVKEVWKQWNGIKSRFLEIVIKLKESWKSETELKEELNYMG